MFFMSTFQLHKTVIKQVVKYRKYCLWQGADIDDKKRLRLLGKWCAYQKLREVLVF
jgi:hypothetical protein